LLDLTKVPAFQPESAGKASRQFSIRRDAVLQTRIDKNWDFIPTTGLFQVKFGHLFLNNERR